MPRQHSFALAACFLLLATTPAAGQTRIGITGGLNLASVDITTGGLFVPEFESVARMSVGLSATTFFSESVGLQLAGSYSQKGGKWDIPDPEVHASLTLNADYLELAGLGMLRLPLAGDRISARLLAGPAVSLETSCEVITEASVGGTKLKSTEDCDEEDGLERSSLDLALMGGGGLEVGLPGSLSLTLDALYSLGLTDIDKSEDDSVKNRVLTVRVGVAFPLG